MKEIRKAQLIGGPQDGCYIVSGKGELPPSVFVHRQWQGDGAAAWSTKPSKRFAVRYNRHGDTWRFAPGTWSVE